MFTSLYTHIETHTLLHAFHLCTKGFRGNVRFHAISRVSLAHLRTAQHLSGSCAVPFQLSKNRWTYWLITCRRVAMLAMLIPHVFASVNYLFSARDVLSEVLWPHHWKGKDMKTPIKRASEYQKAYRERKRREKEAYEIERKMAVEAVKDSFKETLDAIHSEEITDFGELRGLALSTLRDMLVNGAARERLQAANTVLNRTDPERQKFDIEVTIHPIDLTNYLYNKEIQHDNSPHISRNSLQVIDITDSPQDT